MELRLIGAASAGALTVRRRPAGNPARPDEMRAAFFRWRPTRFRSNMDAMASEDLAAYACDVVLRDGSTLRLRPIEPGDAPKLLAMYERLSDESRYYRFFAAPRVDLERATRFATVDYVSEFALVGESAGRIVGVARFIVDPAHPDRAEVAFEIADAVQGRGIGTRMLEQLAQIARSRRITTFDAYVLGENRRMMDVFLDSGFEVTRRLDSGVFHVTLSLRETAEFESRAAARAQRAASASMKVFFEPRSVAVVGANRHRGRIGSEIFHNLKATGFTGRLIPVNPEVTAVEGIRAARRVPEIEGEIDLAVIVVPAAIVEAVVEDCIAKGVKGIVVISAGFAEMGPEGRAREAAIVDRIRAAGIRMIGPNCMGLLNTDPGVRLNATFSPVYPPEGRLALSTQSGALGLAILEYATRLNLGISTFVSIGNKADVSGNDLIQYWAEDPRTDVILLYMESFGNPRKFSQLARRIAREKPIVAVKAGRSTAGARAASSHTGALASSDTIVDALFRQAGVIRTSTLEELFDVAALLAHQPLPPGRRVAILTNAGGPGILAADACESQGLLLPALGERTVDELRRFLPAAASVANPVDMLASASPDDYRRAMRVVLSDPQVDSLVAIFIPPLVTEPAAVAAAIIEGAAASDGKPVVATFMGAQGAPAALSPVPSFMFPESAASALARVASYAEWRRRPVGTLPRLDGVDPPLARAAIEAALARGGGWLTMPEAQQVLGSVGIRSARAMPVGSEAAAADAARAIGFPVALKAVGPTIVHKTDVGGVRLGLGDEAAVRAAWLFMQASLGEDMAGALVQEMVTGGVEILVGAIDDATFGPLLVCGSGGVLAELVADTVFRIHPLTDLDAADMVSQMKSVALLRGYRGSPPADEAALRETLLRASTLLDLCPEIQEMDINPLKVLTRGVCAVDVRIRVGHPPARPATRRVVY
jgi:acetyl coenzyme A synthetase (ADP forming)-like protein